MLLKRKENFFMNHFTNFKYTFESCVKSPQKNLQSQFKNVCKKKKKRNLDFPFLIRDTVELEIIWTLLKSFSTDVSLD